MIIEVRSDIARLHATLDEMGRKQLPFAASLALNRTAATARDGITRRLPEIFDKKGAPTPFTRHAIGITPAKKANLRAEVFVKRRQAKYLAIEETGGSRSAAPGAPILVPVDFTALNAYGNIPRGVVRRLLMNPKRYFMGRIRGVNGVWERVGGTGRRGAPARHVCLLFALRPHGTWHARFGFAQQVRVTVGQRLAPELEAGIAKAIATAIRR